MFGDLFNLAVDVISLPAKVTAVITDEIFDTESSEFIEDIKDHVKVQ